MRLRLLLFLVCATLLPAQNLPEFEKKVTEFQLKNGMKFIVLERHDAPVVAFNSFVNVGSADDPKGQAWMAHMFEHMIGKGIRSVGSKDWGAEEKALAKIEQMYDKLETARKAGNKEAISTLEAELKDAIESANNWVEPNAYPRTIEEEGGVGFNAGTAMDYTTYFYSLPSNKTELWYLMTSEFLKHPVFREFYKERDVVMEERRMRIESNPQGKLIEKMLALAFPSHPYGIFGGSAKEIMSLRASDAAKFHQKYYVPSNITVAIVGDIEPSRAKALAEKYFGDIKTGPPPPPVSAVEPKQDKERRSSIELDSQPMLVVGYKRPDQRHKDDPVFDVISSLLSSGRTGMLYRDLVQQKKIALAAQAGATFPAAKYPNMFILFGLPNAGHTVEEVEKGMYAVVDKLKNEKVDPVSLQRVKTKVRAGLVRQLDSNSGLGSQLPFYEVMYDDWRVMFKGLEDIDKVTADDVQRVAREYFVPEGRTVVYSTAPAKGAAK